MAHLIPVSDAPFHLEAQGRVAKVTVRRNLPAPPPTDATRGTVTEFSRKSRKRLLDLFNRISFSANDTKFLTLTFSGLPTFQEAKAALRRFFERLRRKYERASAVWRMELQDRGSIHFHVVTFGMPYFPQDALQRVWTECTEEMLSIVHIEKVETHDKLINYVAKYVAKADAPPGTTSLDKQPYLHAKDLGAPGRWWGKHNADALPMAELKEITFDSIQMHRYLRWTMRSLSRGYAAGNQFGASLWHEDAYKILKAAHELDDLMPDRPEFERIRWQFVKHGTCTVQALRELMDAESRVGELVSSMREALILVTYRMPTATPQARMRAAERLFRTCQCQD